MIGEALRAGVAVWPVVVPLAAAALALLLRGRPALQRGVMEGALALTLAAVAALLGRVAGGGRVVMAFGGWGAPVGITFVADALSALLATTAGMVALAVAIFARADVRARRRRAGFDPLFLGMLAAVNGAFLTGDLFNLYVWFELMLVTALGLLTLDRRPAQVDGALRYAAMSMTGATCMLLGIGLLYGVAGTLDMGDLSAALAGRPPSVAVTAASYLLLAGLALKAGVFPLFFWLPASYHTAPIGVAAALAGLLTKAAFYACLRVLVTVLGVGTAAAAVPGVPPLLALLAAATMLVSVLAAIAQVDVRRLLAFHVMGQVAYLVMGLSLATAAGAAAAVVYTVHTMLVQTGLFLGAGAIARAGRGYDLRLLGGLIREHPVFAALFAALALSISGIPPLSGFWAKALVVDAAFRSAAPWRGWLAAAALVTGFLTLYSMSTLWTRAFQRPRRREGGAAHRIPTAMVVAVGLMAACTVGLGVAIEPVVRISRVAAAELMAGPAQGGGAP
ncbi:proton-conducting transporter membrane subunit [Roseisolibacter sp. H3M3-2]|uniref:proton-conducting transporter transmembrane domain-containing protein n=1 Tax=Roseisolibacter sp. H3M3-2 TaxID=3031323 RepID=UPI0023DC7260|nr:proton-conducting transporter membrane subunit [Roseisolibacter sp. H3M3-2]MDF1501389.1 proton-conducting transporter membrane subunit [Roseisolibacter sp. H3M3-2]